METLEDFFIDFTTQIAAEASLEEEELFQEQVFIDTFITYLHEIGEIDNGIRCQNKSYGIKIDGYDFDDELNILNLIVSEFKSEFTLPIPNISQTEINKSFKRIEKFAEKALFSKDFSDSIAEVDEVLDLIKVIHANRTELRKIRFILITNGIVKQFEGKTIFNEQNVEISYHVWDLQRLYRFITSGKKKEPISVDLEKMTGEPLPYVGAIDSEKSYSTYLCILPGTLLFDLYDKFGTRLLERNVRAYLQARGKSINAGIRKTLRDSGHRFLAFNNGITATADSLVFKENSDGQTYISRINDFQIVNGGQTTASLWHSKMKDGASLENVYVQMKLTVIEGHAMLEEMVPLISEYSNSQNKVNRADFAANDPFHVNVEKLSRAIWAPDPTGGNNQTIWFYERSRGSYYETRNRERTPSKIKAWDKIHPRNQKFDKVMLAKLEKTWLLQPNTVSEGAQKNFNSFQVDIKEQNLVEVDKYYFIRLIAKLIIWRSAERIVSRQNIPGYRANIVTYSLAYLIKHTSNRLNLEKIWDDQKISDALTETIDFIAYKIRDHITSTQYNVTEYCKKEQCWSKIENDQSIKDGFPENLFPELLETSFKGTNTTTIVPSKKDQDLIDSVVEINYEIWMKISRWGKITNSLEGWENKICYSIGNLIKREKTPSQKQAYQGKRIYEKAVKLGFELE